MPACPSCRKAIEDLKADSPTAQVDCPACPFRGSRQSFDLLPPLQAAVAPEQPVPALIDAGDSRGYSSPKNATYQPGDASPVPQLTDAVDVPKPEQNDVGPVKKRHRKPNRGSDD